MVNVKYINGDEETFETKNNMYSPWTYEKESESYIIPCIEGNIEIPRESIQRLQHISV